MSTSTSSPTRRGVDVELPIRAGKRARFIGRPGTRGGNRAIQVTGIAAGLLHVLDIDLDAELAA